MPTPDLSEKPPFSLAPIFNSIRVPVSSSQPPHTRPMHAGHRLLLSSIMALSTFLSFFQLQHNGYGNLYYATAVRSMLLNWHNFFFVSFDPGGFISIDKPPVDLWLQTLSAKLFGFSGFSLFLPQALAGVLAVIVLFHLVRRAFGPSAGLFSALVMAVTPMGVVISRDNNLDMLLVLVVLLATWAVVRATEHGRIGWLLLGAALIGVGFNVKMFEAYLVIPALGLLYLLCAPRRWWTRIGHVLLALVVLLVISFSWLTIVDLTPPTQRPYVGSSLSDSELELALQYNGIERLFHFPSPPKQPEHRPAKPSEHVLRQPAPTPLFLLSTLVADLQASTSASEAIYLGNGNGSAPGVLRLFTQPISGQIAWLLPLALLSLFILLWQRKWRGPLDQGQQALVLWGTWLLTIATALSIAVHFLTYYTVMLAPAISALAGIGLATLWRDYSQRPRADWRGWILPFVPLVTGILQAVFLIPYPGWSAWMSPLILVLTTLVGVILLLARIFAPHQRLFSRITHQVAVCGALAVVIAPLTWSAVSLTYPASGSGPTAGPRWSDLRATLVAQEHSQPFSENTLDANEHKLLSYLFAQRGKTRFLVGTASTSSAIPLILASGQPVMALGGFSSADPSLTLTQLTRDVGNGTVRFFWLGVSVKLSLSASQLAEAYVPLGGNRPLLNWITTRCRVVPAQDWEPGRVVAVTGKGDEFVPSGNLQYTSNGFVTNLLYDCGGSAH